MSVAVLLIFVTLAHTLHKNIGSQPFVSQYGHSPVMTPTKIWQPVHQNLPANNPMLVTNNPAVPFQICTARNV